MRLYYAEIALLHVYRKSPPSLPPPFNDSAIFRKYVRSKGITAAEAKSREIFPQTEIKKYL